MGDLVTLYRKTLDEALTHGGSAAAFAPHLLPSEAVALLQDIIARHQRIVDQQARLLADLRKLFGPKWQMFVELEEVSLNLDSQYLMSLLVSMKEAGDELVAIRRI